MHALFLALAIGQAEPAAPVPGPAPALAPEPVATDAAPAPAPRPPVPEPAPGPVSAATPAPPAPAPAATAASPDPAPAGAGQSLRAVDLTRLPDGGFRATLDGEAVGGAAFYRAVLRPDLAARNEEERSRRTAVLIAAALAPVAGLGIGWIAGTSQQWPLPPCLGEPPGPVSCTAHDQVAAENASAMNTALVAGGVAGLATGAVLWFLGSRIHPLEPSADEAEALVRAYRARAGPGPATAPARTPGGATLRLEPGPGATGLALGLHF